MLSEVQNRWEVRTAREIPGGDSPSYDWSSFSVDRAHVPEAIPPSLKAAFTVSGQGLFTIDIQSNEFPEYSGS